MLWILAESMHDLPAITHSMEIYNYSGKSKSSLLTVNLHGFHTMDFEIFFEWAKNL